MDPTFTNRTLAVMLIIMVFSFLISITVTSLIFQRPLWPPPVTSVVPAAAVIMVMMVFMIYGARFRDERAIAISDKSARNGFMFFIFITPSLIVLSSLRPDLFPSTAFTLAVVAVSVLIVACLSVLYYYRK